MSDLERLRHGEGRHKAKELVLDQHRTLQPPVFYLDIDGVVTTKAYQQRAGKDKLDPALVALVAQLINEFDAKVVVSSTWRVDDCRSTLVEAGLPRDCFYRDWRTAITARSRDEKTGDMLPARQAGRADEIADHLAGNGISIYLMFDDVDAGTAHAGHHVRPDPRYGLSDADVLRARALLAEQLRKQPDGLRPPYPV